MMVIPQGSEQIFTPTSDEPRGGLLCMFVCWVLLPLCFPPCLFPSTWAMGRLRAPWPDSS